MQQSIKIRNEADITTIDIEGTIGLAESWQFENPDSRVATYERFREAVSHIADIKNASIRVNIRSTGGDVNDALLIYEALRSTEAHITTCCYGYTASAATIVAQAASEGCRYIAPSALYLIHNSLCSTEGNAEELQAEVEMLRQTDRRIAEIYATRSGREVDKIATLMAENGGRGRWLSPEEAIAEGLVDTIAPELSSAHDSATNIVARAKSGVEALLKAIGVGTKSTEEVEREDVNYIKHNIVTTEDSLPENVADSSVIAFSEAQKQVAPTRLKAVEDPQLFERDTTPRSQAYDSDARSIKTTYGR